MKEMEEMQVCKCCGKELPLSMYRSSRLGRLKTCKECTRKHQIETRLDKKIAKLKEKDAIDARSLRLKDFTPRELMAELKRRGFKFTMEYVETHVINSNDIEI